jgi:hypothetical protein
MKQLTTYLTQAMSTCEFLCNVWNWNWDLQVFGCASTCGLQVRNPQVFPWINLLVLARWVWLVFSLSSPPTQVQYLEMTNQEGTAHKLKPSPFWSHPHSGSDLWLQCTLILWELDILHLFALCKVHHIFFPWKLHSLQTRLLAIPCIEQAEMRDTRQLK